MGCGASSPVDKGKGGGVASKSPKDKPAPGLQVYNYKAFFKSPSPKPQALTLSPEPQSYTLNREP